MTALRAAFQHPPDSVRPGVYWYFMDGNMSAEGITSDLEAMKQAGIGKVVFLEVNVGVPRGPVDFLSDEWLDMFDHAVKEASRLGIEITLGIGPGWTGSGGPWVQPAESMQHLVSSTVQVSGGHQGPIQLPLPQPKKPYFGEGSLTHGLKQQWEDFYEDVAVLAFPTPSGDEKITDTDERALYYRAPYTSAPGVKPLLSAPADYPDLPDSAVIAKDQIQDLTGKLGPDGTLNWKVPAGNWTIMRFGRRNNGAVTRPAPVPGLGFEADKMDTAALHHHLNAYIGKVFRKIGVPVKGAAGGLKMLHMDSWEMGAQNWTPGFRQAFMKRRGYDPLPFYPVYAGNIVGSLEMSERFLWDLRQTCQEMVLEYHARAVKQYAHLHGLGLSIEPYDMNPTADLELGAVADIPMGEFWSKGYGFNSAFSCIEATSIAHVNGISVVQAEAFTADGNEAWKQYPGSMKNQGDWAFALGINRFFYHTFEHKPLADSLRPGMNMGPYGVHWDRKQTWWSMADGYHRYVSRCQFILEQGKPVADILYLTPEGAPQVFLPPASALAGDSVLPDRRGYTFDGCAPGQLYKATVKDHRVVFPGGAAYRLLVLPARRTMTPALLQKIGELVKAGAVVVGVPPEKSPGLSGFPECDRQVQAAARSIWGSLTPPEQQTTHSSGEGKVIWGGALTPDTGALYPGYAQTAALLHDMQVPEDFSSEAPLRYAHRATGDWDIYFVSNRSDSTLQAAGTFRTDKGAPELWDPLTGTTRPLPEFSVGNGRTTVPLQFAPYQSFFIVFAKGKASGGPEKNFPASATVATLSRPWTVSFDPQMGGPAQTVFDQLADWTARPEAGIKYYSGIAVYRQNFDLSSASDTGRYRRLILDLGEVKDMARVILNGHDLGVVWTSPRTVDITGIVKEKDNRLEIKVANRWPNRLIGDAQQPDDGIRDGRFPDWLLKGEKRSSGRYTFSTYEPYHKEDALLPSGLLGPVTVRREDYGGAR
ncbi:hypothetical protein GCM10023143_09170 [Compostibacter hankyongensis]|uniref:Beta-mannosidase-like galactose-binding domain-containing protein n=2 Tax=Compostibacter hankyongensis TaxID=1007089 RepID=A0ABP8FJ23_9BACT